MAMIKIINDDKGDDDDDDDDNRAGKFLHRDAALGLHENTSATLGVHLQFEKEEEDGAYAK